MNVRVVLAAILALGISGYLVKLMLGTSEAIPVADGELLLGTWQRIFLVELDGPRSSREVVIQVLGDTY